ncbi:MAG: FadR family transcriptional regulator [Treponema sp.]|jgi:GntR family transcriptional repressor for pyruvate dehydrogenase complex|nr:FadR family transcriptional regulator [Treponema sp.]
MESIKKIKTKSLRSQVYATLKEQLMKGTWQEGEKLPSEHEFCAMFGVSRVTIRAALQQLEILGLVETRHGGGTFVKKFSTCRNIDTLHPLIQIQKNQDLITVMEYRKIIEKGTIGLAVDKITEDDFALLEETYAVMSSPDRDTGEYTQADLDFHHQLARISQNAMIIKVYDLITEILATAMRDLIHLAGKSNGPAFHRKIIDALRRRDKAECEALMEAHIESNIEAIRSLAEKNG